MEITLRNQTINVENGDTIHLYKYEFDPDNDEGIVVTDKVYTVEIMETNIRFNGDPIGYTLSTLETEHMVGTTLHYFYGNVGTKRAYIRFLRIRFSRIKEHTEELYEAQTLNFNERIDRYSRILKELDKEDICNNNGLTDVNIRDLLRFANKVCDKLCGDHAVVDVGSIFTVMDVVLEAIDKLKEKDLKKIQKTVMGDYWLS